MAKKKVNWIIVVAALMGLILGAAQLGYTVMEHSIVSIAALLMGVAILYKFSNIGKKDIDWTVTVSGLLLIAHYFVAEGMVAGGVDVHSSIMLSSGVAGLILLSSRADIF